MGYSLKVRNSWAEPSVTEPSAPQRSQANHVTAFALLLGQGSILLISADLFWTFRSEWGKECLLFFNPDAVYFPWGWISALSKKDPEKQ